MSSRLGPCSRREFIAKLRRLGYYGPFAGGNHQFMAKRGAPPVTLPNPHGRQGGEIVPSLLRRILRNANISPDQWLGA